MNKVMLSGRLTQDPEIRYMSGENAKAVANITLAVNRIKKGSDQSADFIQCVAFGKTAETIEKYVTKGTKLIVEGSWQTGSYTDKQGIKHYTNTCFISSIEFCDSKNNSNNGGVGGVNPPMPSNNNNGWLNVPDGVENSLPFE